MCCAIPSPVLSKGFRPGGVSVCRFLFLVRCQGLVVCVLRGTATRYRLSPSAAFGSWDVGGLRGCPFGAHVSPLFPMSPEWAATFNSSIGPCCLSALFPEGRKCVGAGLCGGGR
jgi:hypothetical protein